METILRKQSGFTLIELLIAVSLLAIGILAVSSMQIMAIRGNAFAKNHTKAYTLAASKIEEFMSLDYNDDVLIDTDGNGESGLDETGTLAAPDSDHIELEENTPDGYEIYWNIANNVPMTGTKSIRVIVKYNIHTIFPRKARIDYIIN